MKIFIVHEIEILYFYLFFVQSSMYYFYILYSSSQHMFGFRTTNLITTSSFAIKSRFDFADELKVGDVRYKHLTQITIKVQLFWRLAYEM